jgi:ribosomal-protein-alanine N-acetyltransferase
MESLEEVRALIEELRAEFAAYRGLAWAVTLKESGSVVGLFGFHFWDHYHRRAELGYDLAHAYWKQGLASQAVRAILRFGFEQMDLHRICSGMKADNQESVRLLERIGFAREGTSTESSGVLEQRYWLGGRKWTIPKSST